MGSITRFAAINTKSRGLIGKFLKNEDYMSLLSEKSVPDVAAYLKHNTHYSDILDGVAESEIHRGGLEALLKRSHISRLEKLIFFFRGNYKEFYGALFIRYEIEDLKTLVKGIKSGRDNTLLKDSLTYIGKYSKVDIDALISSKTIHDLLYNLKGTIYYSYLRPLVEEKEEVDYFSIEMTLDLAYFDIFYTNLKYIRIYDRKIIQKYQDTYVDLLNLQWIYRGLKFYSLPPEELFNYTIAHGREFTRDDIKELCYCSTLDEFQKKVTSTKYSFLFDNENTKDMFMERRMFRYLYFELRKIKKQDGMNISLTMVFSLLSEFEIRDIISVIENIRYSMPVEESKKFLIRRL